MKSKRGRLSVHLAGFALLGAACGVNERPGEASPAVTEEPAVAEASCAPGTDELDARLQALDPEAWPRLIDTSFTTSMQRSLLSLALDAEPEQVAPVLDRELVQSRGRFGRLVLLALSSNAESTPPTLDTQVLEQGFVQYYACEKHYPDTWESFTQNWLNVSSLPATVVEDSMAKGGQRLLFAAVERGIYVAQTPTANGFESEVLVANPNSNAVLGFMAFDDSGQRRNRVSFAATGSSEERAVPLICAGCHRDINTLRVNVINPSGGG